MYFVTDVNNIQYTNIYFVIATVRPRSPLPPSPFPLALSRQFPLLLSSTIQLTKPSNTSQLGSNFNVSKERVMRTSEIRTERPRWSVIITGQRAGDSTLLMTDVWTYIRVSKIWFWTVMMWQLDLDLTIIVIYFHGLLHNCVTIL